jgi:hypothetical protein
MLRGDMGKKLRRHPEVLAAERRASKDRPQAELLAVLRDAAQDSRLLRMTAELFAGMTLFLIILYVN